MSDIDSMAATRATSPSPVISPHASPEPSQDTLSSQIRSPSPAGRSPKRRRTDSAFPEIHANSSHFDGPTNYPSPSVASQPAPNLLPLFNGAYQFETQPRTFLGYDREFMSHILSVRGVTHRARATVRRHPNITSVQFGIESLPLTSADGASFIGWRDKANTWPMEKDLHMLRSLTFPQ